MFFASIVADGMKLPLIRLAKGKAQAATRSSGSNLNISSAFGKSSNDHLGMFKYHKWEYVHFDTN
jgi:hypothetical protein